MVGAKKVICSRQGVQHLIPNTTFSTLFRQLNSISINRFYESFKLHDFLLIFNLSWTDLIFLDFLDFLLSIYIEVKGIFIERLLIRLQFKTNEINWVRVFFCSLFHVDIQCSPGNLQQQYKQHVFGKSSVSFYMQIKTDQSKPILNCQY